MSECGKRASHRSLTEAGKMSTSALLKFIITTAPADVVRRLSTEKVKKREDVCAFLDLFPEGRALKGIAPKMSKSQAASIIQTAFKRAAAPGGAFNIRRSKLGSLTGKVPRQILSYTGAAPRPQKHLYRASRRYEARAYSTIPLDYRHMVRRNAQHKSVIARRQAAARRAVNELNWSTNSNKGKSGSNSNRSSSSAGSYKTVSSSAGSSGSNRNTGSNRNNKGSGSNKGDHEAAFTIKGGNLRSRPENKDPRYGASRRFAGTWFQPRETGKRIEKYRQAFRNENPMRGKRFINLSHELYFGDVDEKKAKKKGKMPRRAGKRNTSPSRSQSYRSLNLPKEYFSSSSSNERASPKRQRSGARITNVKAHRFYNLEKTVRHPALTRMKYPTFASRLARREPVSTRVTGAMPAMSWKQRIEYDRRKKNYYAKRNQRRAIFGESSNSFGSNTSAEGKRRNAMNRKINQNLRKIMQEVRRNIPSNRVGVVVGPPRGYKVKSLSWKSSVKVPRQPLKPGVGPLSRSAYEQLALNLISKMNRNAVLKMTPANVRRKLAAEMGIENVNSIPRLGRVLDMYGLHSASHGHVSKMRKILKRNPKKYHLKTLTTRAPIIYQRTRSKQAPKPGQPRYLREYTGNTSGFSNKYLGRLSNVD